MTDHEKLFRLLLKAFSLHSTIGLDWNDCSLFFPNVKFQEAIDYLLENGVSVRQMQKPIAETDLGKCIDTAVWFEEFGRDVEGIPLLLDGIGFYYAEFKEYGRTERLDRRLDDYNYQWRCWAEKPTEEERKAAEWEK